MTSLAKFNLNFNQRRAAIVPATSAPQQSQPTLLSGAEPGQSFRVRGVVAPSNAPEWAGQLEDLGFIAGEMVSLMARGQPGGEPLVVRVGLSTFALRRVEAACVQVGPAST